MLAVSRSACRAAGSRSRPARPLSPGQWTCDGHGDSSTVTVVCTTPSLATDRRPTNCPQPPCGSFEVMNRTIDIAQAALARHTLAAYPRRPILIEVPRSACRSLDSTAPPRSSRSDMSWPLARSTSWRSRRHRHWTNESVEKLRNVAGHPAALLATCPRRRHPARGVERVGAERGQRLVVGEHTERRTTKRVDLRGAAAAER